MTNPEAINLAGSIRVLHRALVLGLTLVGVVFFFLIRFQHTTFGFGKTIAYTCGGISVAVLAVALLFLRPRIPQRSFDETPADYWRRREITGAALILWSIVEGAGLVSWIGYLLTGQLAVALVALLAIGGLLVLRPSSIEGAA